MQTAKIELTYYIKIQKLLLYYMFFTSHESSTDQRLANIEIMIILL